jgi:hypothetical protein
VGGEAVADHLLLEREVGEERKREERRKKGRREEEEREKRGGRKGSRWLTLPTSYTKLSGVTESSRLLRHDWWTRGDKWLG